MTSREKVDRILAESGSKRERIMLLGALLARESRSGVIVVGGSAIEVYTRSGYVSGDVDVVGERAHLEPLLASWGFAKWPGLWIREDWGLAVDIRGPNYTGDVGRTRTITTPYGAVRLAAPEDLLVKRLAEAQHWKVKEAVAIAALLYAAEREDFDWAYAEGVAKQRGVSMKLLSDFRRRVEAVPVGASPPEPE